MSFVLSLIVSIVTLMVTSIVGPITTTPTPAIPTSSPAVIVTPAPTPSPTPPQSGDVTLAFIQLPASVQSGQKFTIQWQITGPEGVKGDNTTLKVVYENVKQNGGSSSSQSTKTNQSFGSFVVPQTFSTNLSLGNGTGTIFLTLTADVNGHTLTEVRQLSLSD